MHRIKSDKGDVPGWVLITLMTAGLVVLSQNRVIGVLLFRTLYSEKDFPGIASSLSWLVLVPRRETRV